MSPTISYKYSFLIFNYYYLFFVLEKTGRFNNGIRQKDKDNELEKASGYRAERQNETDYKDVKIKNKKKSFLI